MGDLVYAIGRHPCGKLGSEGHPTADEDLSNYRIKHLPPQLSHTLCEGENGKETDM